MIRELLRSAFVIGRRDFTATVLSKTFLLFLLGPLFPVIVMLIMGGIGSKVAADAAQPTVAVVMPKADFEALAEQRERLRSAVAGTPVIQLVHVQSEGDRHGQRKRLLESETRPVVAVLEGSLNDPHLVGDITDHGVIAGQARLLVENARIRNAPRASPGQPLRIEATESSSGSLSSMRSLTARAGQALLFMLTLLLAGMLLSQLIEEKSNKIIEVLAAAVPIDAIFLGKLFAMLCMSLIGIAVWTGVGAAALSLYAERGLSGLPAPAVGWTAFIALMLIYFTMSYLLLGSLFLAIGGHASTVREVQTLSMPVTMAQVAIFGIAALAVGKSGEPLGIAGAVFPLSSPLVMIAQAAEEPDLWVHGLAILWQLAWVALILHMGASMFRRSVMKSGPAGGWWKRSRR